MPKKMSRKVYAYVKSETCTSHSTITTVIHSLNSSLEYANGKGGYSPAERQNIRHMLESVKTGEWAQVLPQLEIWIEQMELGAVGCGGDALSRYAQYRTALGILAR